MVSFSPVATPRSLKGLLLITLVGSLLSPLFPYLALSSRGIDHLFLWQFVSYLFTLPPPFDLSFLLRLGLNLFLLWTFGSSLLERCKPSLFYSLYFTAGVVGGVCALTGMPESLPYFFSGNSTALYAILIPWIFLNPEAQLLLFFTFPVKARWLLIGLIGVNLLLDISAANWPSLFALSGSALYAYLFTLVTWRVKGPFPFLYPLENQLLRFLERLNRIGKKPPAKVYDIYSGKPVLDDDDAFMDEMLTRISKHGENSLSSEEKKRMQEISRRKTGRKP